MITIENLTTKIKKNNFQFFSQEIVNTEMEKKQKTSNNQTQQTQQRLDSKRINTINEEKSNISGKTEWEVRI